MEHASGDTRPPPPPPTRWPGREELSPEVLRLRRPPGFHGAGFRRISPTRPWTGCRSRRSSRRLAVRRPDPLGISWRRPWYASAAGPWASDGASRQEVGAPRSASRGPALLLVVAERHSCRGRAACPFSAWEWLVWDLPDVPMRGSCLAPCIDRGR